MSDKIKPICVGCGMKPNEIPEYIEMGAEDMMTPEEWVKAEEGTYNPFNGHFYCTLCYHEAGLPIGLAP